MRGNATFFSRTAAISALLFVVQNVDKALETGFQTGGARLGIQCLLENRLVLDASDDHLIDHGIRTAREGGQQDNAVHLVLEGENRADQLAADHPRNHL